MADIRIIEGYVPGAVGRVTELHADYYSRNWEFGVFFEAKVASELAEFMGRYDERQDRIWSAVVRDRIEASITVDGVDAGRAGAHLRWFIAADAVRGQGLGGELMAAAIKFCRAREYPRMYLWTFRGLESAKHLYEKAGFVLTESHRGCQWGSSVVEQRYEATFR